MASLPDQVEWRRFATRVSRRAVSEFFDDQCPQFAAAISFRVLFSLFPLAIVVTVGFSIVIGALGTKADVIDTIVRQVPLTGDGKEQLRDLLREATDSGAALGIAGVLGLVWAATGAMTSLRIALNRAWDADSPRPFVQGKAVDFGAMVGAALLITLSVASTVFVRVAADAIPGIPDRPPGWLLGSLFPLALAFGVALALFRLVPATETRVRDIWPGALFAALAFVALQNLFSLYLQHFGGYSAVYGSLGAVIAFLVFVYLSASFLLLGAELAAEWPRVLASLRRGEGDDDEPLREQVRGFLRGLLVRDGGRR